MIHIIRTHDMRFVHEVYRHPQIYGKVIDDFCPPANQLIVKDTNEKYFLIPHNDEGEGMGVICLHPHNHVLYQIHVSMLPKFWGKKRAEESVLQAFEWMRKNTECKKIISITPVIYRLSIRLAKRVGGEHEGTLIKSIQLKGQLIDQEIYGVNLWELNL